ncbi:MAG: alpha/beta hydrolase [Gammaproteobacteria bacterium]|nr:MAG: alpha/beta hydrolase [Gammaproteobacteria bacterium]
MKAISSITKKLTTLSLFLFLIFTQYSNAEKLERISFFSNNHPMILWHKQPSTKNGNFEQILLLHGRTWSSLPDFDLQVKGEKLSLMDNLVELGFSVWALDARGYGETKRDDSGWNNPNKAALDVKNTMQWITNKTSNKPTLFGWSYGSMVSQLVVQKYPNIAKSVILYGYPIDPEQIIAKQTQNSSPKREINTKTNAASDFIIPGSISQQAIDIYVIESLKADPIRADWNHLDEWNQLDAAKITTPLLLLQGEHDPLAKSESHARFFIRLPNANKQWIVLAGGDHAALLETPKFRLAHSIRDFVNWLKLD